MPPYTQAGQTLQVFIMNLERYYFIYFRYIVYMTRSRKICSLKIPLEIPEMSWNTFLSKLESWVDQNFLPLVILGKFWEKMETPWKMEKNGKLKISKMHSDVRWCDETHLYLWKRSQFNHFFPSVLSTEDILGQRLQWMCLLGSVLARVFESADWFFWFF